jgi:hypothetical protein
MDPPVITRILVEVDHVLWIAVRQMHAKCGTQADKGEQSSGPAGTEADEKRQSTGSGATAPLSCSQSTIPCR